MQADTFWGMDWDALDEHFGQQVASPVSVTPNAIDTPDPPVRFGGAKSRKLTPETRYCSLQFRDEVESMFPGLGEHPSRWGLLQYLLWSRHRDADGKTVLWHAAIARTLGYSEDQIARGDAFSAYVALQDFSDAVVPLDIVPYVSYQAKARVLASDLPPELLAAYRAERRARRTPRCEFATGRVVTARTQAEIERADAEKAKLASERLRRASNESKLDYLNGRPRNAYTKIVNENIDKALAVAEDERDLDILAYVQTQPKPFYMPVAGSDRVYPSNESIPRLSREVREALTTGWAKGDLAGAQLAVITRLWEPTASATGPGVWYNWLDWLKVPCTRRNKGALKAATYAFLFGGSASTIRKELSAIGDGRKLWERLRSELVFKELRAARTKMMRRIKRQRYVADAWGEVHHLVTSWERDPHTGRVVPKTNVRRLMATQAQSYEQKLMAPVYELARLHPTQISITADLFDGYLFSCSDQSRRLSWCRRMGEAVAKAAKDMGANTGLEFEIDGEPIAVMDDEDHGW